MIAPPRTLGFPRLHLRRTSSTNERARALALAGARHGTLVTAGEQTAGRGRQGRSWIAPPDSSLLCSLVIRQPPRLLSLLAGVAVCDAIGRGARLKWPNDVVAGPRLAKLGGILVEGRPQEGWAVLGIGLNVAVDLDELPAELRGRAGTLGASASEIEPTLGRLLTALERWLPASTESLLVAWGERDALRGREIALGRLHGVAAGVDEDGRLIVERADGSTEKLASGEVHLGSASAET